MRSQFGNRLFRLFFIFSLLPLVAMAVVGYYLATESINIISPGGTAHAEHVARFFIDDMNERIDTSIGLFSAGVYQDDLDFLIKLQDDTSYEAVPGFGGLTSLEIGVILRDRDNDGRGLVTISGKTFQFCSKTLDLHSTLLGGVTYDGSIDSVIAKAQLTQSVSGARQMNRLDYLKFLAALFVFLALLSGLIAYYFSKRIARSISSPLAELVQATERVASGNFYQPIKVKGTDELAQLQMSFNAMSGKLRTTTEKLTQTERVAAWRNIARRLAHDLRNPLQPIIVSLFQIEQVMSDKTDYEQIRGSLKAASEELQQLKKLADRFSELAKLPPPRNEYINLKNLLETALELYRRQLGTERISAELSEADLMIECDETYLREVLHNLMKNSVDAVGNEGNINVAVREDEEFVLIMINDNGQGMDQDTLAMARLPYFTTKETGSGLGLAVVEKTISEMGGSLSIESESGTGTKVTISLPRKSRL